MELDLRRWLHPILNFQVCLHTCVLKFGPKQPPYRAKQTGCDLLQTQIAIWLIDELFNHSYWKSVISCRISSQQEAKSCQKVTTLISKGWQCPVWLFPSAWLYIKPAHEGIHEQFWRDLAVAFWNYLLVSKNFAKSILFQIFLGQCKRQEHLSRRKWKH